MKKNKKLDAALNRLADLFENGQLLAATDPASFIDEVADNVGHMRRLLHMLWEWTNHFGVELCPGTHPDTYGEGVRETKAHVRRMLDDSQWRAKTGDEVPWDTETIAYNQPPTAQKRHDGQ